MLGIGCAVLVVWLLGISAADAARARPPKALLINLPRHRERFDTVKAQLQEAGVGYERAPAVDGKLLTPAELEANVTKLGRALMTKGMIGCFLSHRKCWQRCANAEGGRLIVFEDDVDLDGNFTAALEEAMGDLPDDWDVLLLGALGAVHPKYYGLNVMHAVMAGGMRWPRWRSSSIHTPLRPFGTHAYIVSASGAKKLLAAVPKASYHVDVVAWGQPDLRLFAVHPLLAKQTHGDTTIGGATDRSWLPHFTIDHYSGTDFAWAWNAPLFQVAGLLITAGRAFSGGVLQCLLYLILRRPAFLYSLCAYSFSMYATVQLLTWPQQRIRPPVQQQRLSA